MSEPTVQSNQETHHRHRWNSSGYATGLVFIGLVAIIWAASSVFLQYLYTSDHAHAFHSPFLVTYIGVSLFALWLPIHKLAVAFCWEDPGDFTYQTVASAAGSIIPNNNIDEANGEEGGDQCSMAPGIRESITTSFGDHSSPLQPHGLPIAHLSMEEELENNTNTDGYHRQSIGTDDEFIVSTNAVEASPEAAADQSSWTEAEHVRVATYIAPVWFLANWTYNASLAYTSISSSTVLASTGSLFTFLFAIVSGDEGYSRLKFSGVLLGVLGSLLTARNDATSADNSDPGTDESDDSSSQRRLLGDVLGLISAVGYGAYAVQTRVFCPFDESRYSMQILLGYIGLLNMIVLSPFAFYLIFSSGGTTHLTWVIVGFLVVKGLFDNVLSDYLWLRAVMLTSATTATVGLGLTIPLAFASDLFLANGSSISATQMCGALAVLAGFVLVNLGNNNHDSIDHNDEREEEQEALRIENGEAHVQIADPIAPFADESQSREILSDKHTIT